MDILEIYFVEHVKKVANFGAVDDWFVGICEYAMQHGETQRCQGVFERIIGHTNNKRRELADLLGASYRDMGLHSRAYKYFFKARNERQVCLCLEQVMRNGYESEQDIFVARACLEMLIKSTDLGQTRAIRQHFKGLKQTPILNFVDFLVECIEMKEFGLVKQMANVDYEDELRRDPSFYEKVNAICEKYFQQSIKKQNPMQAMLSNLLGGGGGAGGNPLAALTGGAGGGPSQGNALF